MSVVVVVREVNLKTLTGRDHSAYTTLEAAYAAVQGLRKKRGNWKTDSIVHGVSRRSMEEVSDVEVQADRAAAS